VLQAALRINAQAEMGQVVPTELAFALRYEMGSAETGRFTRVLRATPGGTNSSSNRSSPERAPPAAR
jgi:hypothetical protein